MLKAAQILGSTRIEVSQALSQGLYPFDGREEEKPWERGLQFPSFHGFFDDLSSEYVRMLNLNTWDTGTKIRQPVNSGGFSPGRCTITIHVEISLNIELIFILERDTICIFSVGNCAFQLSCFSQPKRTTTTKKTKQTNKQLKTLTPLSDQTERF